MKYLRPVSYTHLLFFEKRIPQPSPEFDLDQPILPQIREKDKLLSYPFESMKPFLRMLHEAANDKSVIAIKMTLYLSLIHI